MEFQDKITKKLDGWQIGGISVGVAIGAIALGFYIYNSYLQNKVMRLTIKKFRMDGIIDDSLIAKGLYQTEVLAGVAEKNAAQQTQEQFKQQI